MSVLDIFRPWRRAVQIADGWNPAEVQHLAEVKRFTDGYFDVEPWGFFGYVGGGGYTKVEDVESSFTGYIQAAYKSSGVVFACMAARMMIFSEARFQWQSLAKQGHPGGVFGTRELEPLEHPWPNGTTGELLARMIQDVDLAGNFYAVREGDRLRRLRPDWVTIILSNPPAISVQSDVIGYRYSPGGGRVGADAEPEDEIFTTDEMVHWSPVPDPEAQYRGMSWLTPVLREVQADKAATAHKLKFFENGASPQVVVSLKQDMTAEQFRDFIRADAEATQGVNNAYRTMYVGGGADVTVVGSDLRQLDFKATQGAGETRIAAAARIHPVIVGLSEGMQGSSLNAGNFSAARRIVADGTMRPLWRSACAALENVLDKPSGGPTRLWYDDRDIAFLREDAKDAADIEQIKATTITQYVREGFTPESAILAVNTQDVTLLKHSGLVSVQLQPPGTTADGEPPGKALPAPMTPATTTRSHRHSSLLWPASTDVRRKFNPSQPRNPHTGEWIDIPGGGKLLDDLAADIFGNTREGGKWFDDDGIYMTDAYVERYGLPVTHSGFANARSGRYSVVYSIAGVGFETGRDIHVMWERDGGPSDALYTRDVDDVRTDVFDADAARSLSDDLEFTSDASMVGRPVDDAGEDIGGEAFGVGESITNAATGIRLTSAPRGAVIVGGLGRNGKDVSFTEGEVAEFWESLRSIADLVDEHGGVEVSRDAAFEAKHKRGPGGRFSTMASKIAKALEDFLDGDGDGDPFKDFLNPDPAKRREQLRKVAKARGITLKRGATEHDIVEALKADLKGVKGDKPDVKPDAKPDAPGKSTPPAKRVSPSVAVPLSYSVERGLRPRPKGMSQERAEDIEISLRQYQGGLFTDVNDYLKGRGSARFRSIADDIDEVLASSPLRDDIVVYRGVRRRTAQPFLDAEVGQVVTEKGFLSTSTRRKVAGDFTEKDGSVVLEIHAPKGTGAIRLGGARGAGEAEILLERDLALRVTEDRGTIAGARHLVVEVVPSDVPEKPKAPRKRTPAKTVADLERGKVPSVSAAAKSTNSRYGSTNESSPVYRDLARASRRWTSDMGPPPSGAFEMNCTYVVMAFDMRMRGYDVQAAPMDVLDKHGYAGGLTNRELDGLLSGSWRLRDGKPHGRTFADQQWRSFGEIEAEVAEWPEGGRGFMNVGKHVFSVVKKDGKVQYVEAQFDATPSRTVTSIYRKKYGGKHGQAKVIRLDDLEPTDDILKIIEART